MIRGVLFGLGLIALGGTGFSQPADESDRRWFRVTLDPPTAATAGVWVGGEIVLHVQFVSADPFKRVRFRLPAIEGARSTVLAQARTRKVDIVDEDGYSTLDSQKYSHEIRISLVPERSGTLVIPPITATGIAEPVGRRSFEFEDIHPEQTLVVHPTDPEWAGDAGLVSRQVAIRDSWSRALADIRNGDTVRRTVTLRAAGLTADDLPEFHLESRTGHRVLRTEVVTETEKTERGLVAHLQQSWDIHFETEDVTHVDGVALAYWNPELGRPETAVLAATRVEPRMRDAAALRDRLRAQAHAGHQARRLGLWGLVSVPMAILAAGILLTLRHALPTGADRRLWRASRQCTDPLDFYRAFLVWGRATFGPRPVTGRAEVSELGTRATEQIDRLHASVFGAGGGRPRLRTLAGVLILSSRRRALRRFLQTLIPGTARFLFLR